MFLSVAMVNLAMSHPVRGAWIEMASAAVGAAFACGRTPSGVRGLKSKKVLDIAV